MPGAVSVCSKASYAYQLNQQCSTSVHWAVDRAVSHDSWRVCCVQVLGEIRPYLVGTGGGELILDSIDGPIVKIKITGPAANVMTVRVAVTQKLREKIPSIAAVQLL